MVSIIIPVYNVEPYIEKTLLSILNQSYKDYEIILIDDESKDASIAKAVDVFNKIGFVNYTIFEEKNSGQGVARNYGMKMAKGEWIFFMDSDDLIAEETIESLVRTGEKDDADMVFCHFKFYRRDRVEEKKRECLTKLYEREQIQKLFLERKKKILVPGTLYKTSWIKENDINFKSIRFSEDLLFLWETLRYAKRVSEVEASFYTYVLHNNSTMTSSSPERMLGAYEQYCDYFQEIANDEKMIAEVRKWMLPRWVLGVMRSGARLMTWKEYKIFADKISYSKWCKELEQFPDCKVRILSRVARKKLKLYYGIFAR